MRGKKVKYLRKLNAYLMQHGIITEGTHFRHTKKAYNKLNCLRRSRYHD